jgi:hypothetical protein
MIGDYPSQSFFQVDSITGVIRTTNNLRLDYGYSSSYIARVTAVDDARPNQVATATVLFSVIRNPNGPRFLLPSYANTIPETTAIGSVVQNVTAVDDDANVSLKKMSKQFQILILISAYETFCSVIEKSEILNYSQRL